MNMEPIRSLTIDGIVYVPLEPKPITNRKIVRSRGAGVFFGTIESRDDAKQQVTMTDARRIWYWDGAASLSELAMSGTSKPGSCKFPEAVAKVELFEVCEILDATEVAAKSIDGVKIWKA